MNGVVVGVDASNLPLAPLRQGTHEARMRQARLKVVSVWSYPPLSTEERLLTTASALEFETIERVGEAVAELRGEAERCELTIEVDVIQGAPGKVLIVAATGSDLLVVGRSDGSRFRRLLLGSVADQCVRHATVPVMVVPPVWEEPDRGEGDTVVVGMDYSETSFEALRWALGEAALHGAAVRVVHCWEEPMVVGGDLLMELPEAAALERDADERISRYVAAIEAPDGVSVTGETRRGPPSEALLEAADGSALVVVGTRGLGGFKGLLLGSVARRITHLATCPVTVVPAISTKER